MLQITATLASLILAATMLAVIAAVVADDWNAVVRALVRPRGRVATQGVRRRRPYRRALIVRISPQSSPQQRAVA